MGHSDTQFQVVEVKSDSGKNYYLEGFVSTTDPDLVHDVVTEEAQRSILSQLKNMNITVDDDHDSHRDNKTGKVFDRTKNKIPLALIEHAELRETSKGSTGVWVRALLNKDYPLFEQYLNSIKKGFVHSFSIAYKVTNFIKETIGSTMYRIINGLNILNIGATGAPVNNNATFDLDLKSFNKMVEEEKKSIQLEAEMKELKSSLAALTSEKETLSQEVLGLKAENKTYKANEEEAEKKKKKDGEEEKEDKKEMKSFTDRLTALESENKELKSFIESPQLKSLVEAKSADPANTQTKKTAWDYT